MHQYFKQMPSMAQDGPAPAPLGEDNAQNIRQVEQKVADMAGAVRGAGISADKLHQRGQLTVWERIEAVVEPGGFLPLMSIYNPEDNPEGSTGVAWGLGRVSGRWCVVAGFDNKVLAGAWLPGQAEKKLRAQEVAARLRLPLVWLVNCSGVKLTEQHRVYPGRRGNGATFFGNVRLSVAGLPQVAAVFGTNPAGGGYTSCSPTKIIAKSDANMSVGGGAVLAGMAGSGPFSEAEALDIIAELAARSAAPPGSAAVHHDVTGFFSKVFDTEQEVLAEVRRQVAMLPAYDPEFFRVDEPADPALSADEMYELLPFDQATGYDVEQILARLVDGSAHREFRPGYGPEIYCGLVKLSGLPVGVVANRQGDMPEGYPEYAQGEYQGKGGTIYRQGLIKMAEFVSLCARDRLPMIWFQDHDGLDVGDLAEKAEVLGLGQTLVYGIEQSDLPIMTVVLRKGTVAPHYQMAGPPAGANNAFTLGTACSEIYVMRGRSAAVAALGRKLARAHKEGQPLGPVIEEMNAQVADYHDKSRPWYMAQTGMIDEVAELGALRAYMSAFAQAAYQNPASVCPRHQMLLPRIIKG